MGTDLTGMVEILTETGWQPVIAPVWPNAKYGYEPGERPFDIHPSFARHYPLFSVLADVRNRTGRGKVYKQTHEIPGHGPITVDYDTDDGGHDPLVPIDLPRGVPEDCNDAWKVFNEQSMLHDPTWFTLKELEQGPWDQMIYKQGVAPEEEYLRFLKTGEPPRNYARGIGGPGMRTVNEVEYAAGERGEQTAVDFRWTGKTVYEDAPNSWWATLAVMHLVAPDGDDERVRLLLVFDS